MSEARFVLIGGPFEIYDTPFSGEFHTAKPFGTVFEMPAELGEHAVRHGAALLPEEHFAEIGFTTEEIARYPHAAKQMEAPAAFQEKLKAARVALANYRAQLAHEG